MKIISHIRKSVLPFFAVALSSVLYGCAENGTDVISTIPDGTYITLRWAQADGTRTMTPGEPDSRDESMISNAAILFFDRDHNLIADMMADEIEWTFGPNGAGKSKPIKLNGDMPYGDYWIYIVANAANSVDLGNVSRLDQLTGVHDVSANVENLFSPGSFLMTNSYDEITAPGKANGGAFVSINPHQKEGSYDDPIQVGIVLERLSAKVTVEGSPDRPSVIGKTLKGAQTPVTIEQLDVEEFTLINCVNQINMIQQWKPGGSYTRPEARDMLVVSPSSNTRYPMVSGYYNRVSEIGPEDFVTTENPLFCLENNSPYYMEELGITDNNALEKTKMKGRTTGVVFSAKATLSTGGSDTFYRYRSRLYSSPAAIRADYPGEITDSDDISDLRADKVEVFENGRMYYTYWIKDSNYTDGGENYYAVIRNTWYKLEIADIIDVGGDVPGGRGYDEESPIDEQAAIVIDLGVNAWRIMPDNEHTLGGGDVL